MKKKVSVIIPIYNAAEYLSKTLICLLNQDYQNYEVVAINDGSNDNSEKILKKFLEKFNEKKIKLIIVHRKKNEGLCAAINSGIELSTGEYMCFPDADDEIAFDYISSMMKVLEQDCSRKWVRCNYTIVLEEENREYDVILPSKSFYKNDCYDFISKFIPHNAWNMIVERDYFYKCIGNQIYNSRLTQEWSLLIPLSYYSDYARCDKILYRYYIRKNSMSSWQHKDIKSVIDHFDELKQLNLIVIESLKSNDLNFLYISKKVLDIYYGLMKYKKYAQNSYKELAEKELSGLYANSYDILGADYIDMINDPDLYVRIVFDKLLEADTREAEQRYINYRNVVENGFVIVCDTQGEKLINSLILAYGKPIKVINYLEYEAIQWKSVIKMCLIENSQKYRNIINSDPENSKQYYDYRDIRDSLRGWAVKEVII